MSTGLTTEPPQSRGLSYVPSMWWKRAAIAVTVVLMVGGIPAPARAQPLLPDPATAPVSGQVVRGFDPPDADWLSGHRGVDLATRPGAPVMAAAAGTVAFAGLVAGRGVVSITHGSVRTTYEPVAALVRAGQPVALGEVIGTAQAGHPECLAAACVHWGLKDGEEYLDPQLLLRAAPSAVRLLPEGSHQKVSDRINARIATATASDLVGGVLSVPVAGTITSPFGMRIDPIKRTWRLHSGIDFGAPCGAPIMAAHAGVVSSVAWHPSYGHRLLLDHPASQGERLTTAYNHAAGYSVRPGQHVEAGHVLGFVGTTGDSTGCHLHFMVYSNDRVTDPTPYLTPQ